MTLLQNLGQGFTSLFEEIRDYFTDNILISWLPADIQIVVGAVIIVLLIVAIKRAVLS